jgi:TldD protein
MKAHLQALIARHARECDYLEIRIEESESTSIHFRGRELDSLRCNQERGGCVRALIKGGWGFATFNNLERLEFFIRAAITQARLTGRGESMLAPVDPVVAEVAPEILHDPRDVPLERKIGVLSDYCRLMLETDPRVNTCSAGYGESYKVIRLATSEGTYLHQERLDIGCNLVPKSTRNGQTQIAMVSTGSSNDFEVVLGMEEELVEACRLAGDLAEAPSIKGGVYTVVADPVMAGTFIHEAFGHTSEADKIYENERLQEIMKLGSVFGSPILNVYDTGLITGSRGQIAFDEEGVPAQKTYLIREGRLVGRLHSRETAGKMGERPTGNARAVSYRYPPIPRMRTTCIEGGETPFEEMIREIPFGVYACRAFGGQGGEMFTFTAGWGYMIRDGRLAELVKDITLQGNLFETLKNIDAVGNDFFVHESGGGCGKGEQFPLPVGQASPHIRIRNVVIGGR